MEKLVTRTVWWHPESDSYVLLTAPTEQEVMELIEVGEVYDTEQLAARIEAEREEAVKEATVRWQASANEDVVKSLDEAYIKGRREALEEVRNWLHGDGTDDCGWLYNQVV